MNRSKSAALSLGLDRRVVEQVHLIAVALKAEDRRLGPFRAGISPPRGPPARSRLL